MTKQQRAEIRARADAATKGPWRMSPTLYIGKDGGKHGYRELISQAAAFWIAKVQVFTDDPTGRANGEFCAHARSDIPALIDALEASDAAVVGAAAMRKVLELITRLEDNSAIELRAAGYDCPVLPWMAQAKAALQSVSGVKLPAEHETELEKRDSIIVTLKTDHADLLELHAEDTEKRDATIAAYREVFEMIDSQNLVQIWELRPEQAAKVHSLLQSPDPAADLLKRHAEELAAIRLELAHTQQALKMMADSMTCEAFTLTQNRLAAATKRAEEAEVSARDAHRIINELNHELGDKETALAELGLQLEYDRTAVADGLTIAKRAIASRNWLAGGGRGSYEWDDDRFRAEFGQAIIDIGGALEPLAKIAADWSNCPRTGAAIAEARRDLTAELATLRATLVHSTAEWEKVNQACLDERNVALERARKAEGDTARRLEREREACIDIYEHYFDLPKHAISRACAREKVRERAAMSEAPKGKA